jgi:hypothetical protein
MNGTTKATSMIPLLSMIPLGAAVVASFTQRQPIRIRIGRVRRRRRSQT